MCNKINKKEYINYQWDKENQEKMIEDINNIILEKTRDEWVEFFKDSNICFTPILNMEEMISHPQVIEREMIKKISNFKNYGNDLILTGVPIKLSDTPGEAKYIFPEIGENNEEILTKIGYCKEEIENLRSKDII